MQNFDNKVYMFTGLIYAKSGNFLVCTTSRTVFTIGSHPDSL